MELIPKELEAILPPLYAQESVDDPIAFIKLFDPCSRYTFFVLEAQREPDGDLNLFGFYRSPIGPDEDKFGWASLREDRRAWVSSAISTSHRRPFRH